MSDHTSHARQFKTRQDKTDRVLTTGRRFLRRLQCWSLSRWRWRWRRYVARVSSRAINAVILRDPRYTSDRPPEPLTHLNDSRLAVKINSREVKGVRYLTRRRLTSSRTRSRSVCSSSCDFRSSAISSVRTVRSLWYRSAAFLSSSFAAVSSTICAFRESISVLEVAGSLSSG